MLDAVKENLVEDFLSQKTLIESIHRWDSDSVLSDVLRGVAMPYLSEIPRANLSEALFFINFPKKKKLTERISASLSPERPFVFCKGIGLYPTAVITESDLAKVVKTSKMLMQDDPKWLREAAEGVEGICDSRKKQILAEMYSFARENFSHQEAVDFAKDTLLCEGDWRASIYPPSSVQNSRREMDRSTVTGGFRFTAGGGERVRDRLKSAHRKILSRRNRSGTASRLSTVRQAIQRREALRKATEWHKRSPNSPRFHQALGQHLHRSQGLYQATKECASHLKHFRLEESALRMFTSGKRYEEGVVKFFLLPPLVESEIKVGTTHKMQKGTHSAILRKGGKDTYLKEGTTIKVDHITPAKDWHGDYPNHPMGQTIVEVEVLDGDYKGSFVEFDGVDLAEAIGLNETRAEIGNKILESKAGYAKGGIFVDSHLGKASEIVISSFDSMLSERAVGAVIRSFGAATTPSTIVRVYNDPPKPRELQESIFLSENINGRVIAKRGIVSLIEEEDPKAEQVRQSYGQQKKRRKETFNRTKDDLTKATTNDKDEKKKRIQDQYQKDMEALKEKEKQELERIKGKKKNESVSEDVWIKYREVIRASIKNPESVHPEEALKSVALTQQGAIDAADVERAKKILAEELGVSEQQMKSFPERVKTVLASAMHKMKNTLFSKTAMIATLLVTNVFTGIFGLHATSEMNRLGTEREAETSRKIEVQKELAQAKSELAIANIKASEMQKERDAMSYNDKVLLSKVIPSAKKILDNKIFQFIASNKHGNNDGAAILYFGDDGSSPTKEVLLYQDDVRYLRSVYEVASETAREYALGGNVSAWKAAKSLGAPNTTTLKNLQEISAAGSATAFVIVQVGEFSKLGTMEDMGRDTSVKKINLGEFNLAVGSGLHDKLIADFISSVKSGQNESLFFLPLDLVERKHRLLEGIRHE